MLVSTMENETTARFRSLLRSVSFRNQTAPTVLRTPVAGHGLFVEITHLPPVSSIEMVLPRMIVKRFRVTYDPLESSLTVDMGTNSRTGNGPQGRLFLQPAVAGRIG